MLRARRARRRRSSSAPSSSSSSASAVVAQVVLSGGSQRRRTSSINIAWGLAVTLGVYVAGGVSGAHLNPAVTLAVAVHRGFPWRKVLPYVAAQIAGAFTAAAVVFADLPRRLRPLRRRHAPGHGPEGHGGHLRDLPAGFPEHRARRPRRPGGGHGAPGRAHLRPHRPAATSRPPGRLVPDPLRRCWWSLIGMTLRLQRRLRDQPRPRPRPAALHVRRRAGAARSSAPATAGGGCPSSARWSAASLGGWRLRPVHRAPSPGGDEGEGGGMSGRFVLALDQGTTSQPRDRLRPRRPRGRRRRSRSSRRSSPGPGHVEHDPEAIWSSQLAVAREALGQGRRSAPTDVAAIGITNQRETTVLWDRHTGKPVANAIVWQSRVSAPICERLKADGHEEIFRAQDRAWSSTPTSRAPRSSTCSTRSPACARAPRRATCCSAPSTPSSSGGSPAAACTSPT